ncbi:DEAD/DEAH box helicase [Prosthecobacter sp.]|uniref:DEAD/DEAH box helicase n=1 Tax=Prosthecobacter sp. TaxID=1965333 RepID=UPI002AB863AC|nr:DEAD/DEAH box helicase [Prosthecobacter sp.]MDZ4403080.1 DEAD/DEAH box helicase [Prosthecobacter sp.]
MTSLISDLPVLLRPFDERTRQEAERLVDDDAVIGLELLPDEMMAEVRLDDRAAQVRWLRGEHGWHGETDVDDDEALENLALCATLVAIRRREARGTLPQTPVEEEDFEQNLATKLGRQLTPDEENYLSKLEKRYERVRLTGKIFDQDLVRLHPKWAIQSLEPAALWPEAPKNLNEFWNYIALALADKGLAPPVFLRGMADIDGTREALREWRHASTVPTWRKRIRDFIDARHEADRSKPQPSRDCDFRLLVTVNDVRLQIRLGGETPSPFTNVDAALLDTLRHEHRDGRIVTSGPAELLLVSCFAQSEEDWNDTFRLESKHHAQWLATLFQQPALNDRLVTLDEAPFQQVAEPLRWASKLGKDGLTLALQLETADGTPAPLPLRILRGVKTWYLSSDTLFHGPVWLHDESRIDAGITLPLEALATPEGIAFMREIVIAVPDSIQGRVQHEDLRVKITAACIAKVPHSSGAEFVTFKAEAVDGEGRVRETLRISGWQPVDEKKTTDTSDAIICRDRRALRDTEALMNQLRRTWDGESDGWRVRMAKDFPEVFHQWAAQLPGNVSLNADEQLQTILADPLIARVRLEATQAGSIDWLDLKLVFDIEGADLKPADIRRLIAAKGDFVRLADGSWRRVKLELSEEQQQLLDRLGIDLDEHSDETHRLHWRQLAQENAAEIVNPKAWGKIVERMEEAKLDMRPPVPEELQVTLRPYQVEGYHFLTYLTTNRFGGILADDMGLGKTLQSIAWVLWLRSRKKPDSPHLPVLVVCPKSVLDVWALEFKKGSPDLRVLVLHDRDMFDLNLVQTQIDVLVINYAQMRNAIEELGAIRWLAAILDEGQQIKNPDSKAAKAARLLRADNRLVLTGTPLENRLLDLWSLMTFATPGALGERGYFHRHFDRRKDPRASERLAARLRPFLLRRTKGQVARDLPSRSEENMLCEMSGRQAELYKEELARAQHLVLSSSGFDMVNRRRFAILQALTRLRQICCHPGLIDKTAENEESAKLTATLELIQELNAEGHKVLLFSQFVSMLKIIRTKLDEMKLPYHWLTGASVDRAGIVRGFQEDENASVFLLSLKAGGSGLNLTAASYVILYDPWWNPAVENQAIDRAHRIGQTQPVMAYRMLTRSTIEEKIMTLQHKKNLMVNNVLGEGGFTQLLQKEDFDFLFDIEAERGA